MEGRGSVALKTLAKRTSLHSSPRFAAECPKPRGDVRELKTYDGEDPALANSTLTSPRVGSRRLVRQPCTFRRVHHVGIAVQALRHLVANNVDETLEHGL